MTKDADFKVLVRARMARTGESYAAARAQLRPPNPPVLHVTNGDSTVGVMRGAGLTGTILPWRDVLHEGPVPPLDIDALREVRVAHLAACGWTPVDRARAEFAARDATLDHHAGEILLWFEADLYDQLQLIEILSRLHGRGVDPARITLVCIGEYPGIGHFGGLGELTPDQLAGLLDTGAALTATAVEFAVRAWAAFRAPTPEGLGGIASTVLGDLRFVGEAFDRLGREYPSTRDGLSLTERRILAAVADGAGTHTEIFLRTQAREVRPFLGDTTCFRLIDGLGAGPRPLLATVDGRLGLTDDGRRVLDGTADRIDLLGIDRWIGGVHLRGAEPMWRWHEGTETLISTAH